MLDEKEKISYGIPVAKTDQYRRRRGLWSHAHMFVYARYISVFPVISGTA